MIDAMFGLALVLGFIYVLAAATYLISELMKKICKK